ncbi:MAG: peptidylprolyl isomerase [Roseobacter sp.]
MSHLTKILSAMFLWSATSFGQPGLAQSIFSPVAYVNDSVITEFEVEQRIQFLTLLNAPGSSRDTVIKTLIDERLRAQEIARVGLEMSQEAVDAGLEEFAGRVNLSVEEFTIALEENGVAAQTFEGFVRIGISWRDYIGSRFGRRLEISESEIDQALGSTSGATTIRVLLSEIIIPAPPERLQEVEDVAKTIAASTSQSEFSDFARKYSATATRSSGGLLDWQSLSNLPAVLRPLLLALAPGEITEPINIEGGVALFQLRDIQESGVAAETFAAIDYVTYFLPGGRSPAGLTAAQKLRSEVDVCDDLYGVAQGQPPEVLQRESKPPSEIPADIALELSKLDPGETSIALTRSNGETLVFLMMCGRTAVANEDVAREEVAGALRARRLTDIADSFLEQLRADARITFP